MEKAAKDLDFMEAARLRDELLEIEGELIEAKKEEIAAISQEIVAQKENTDVEKDYNYARDNIYEIIENGQEALEELMEVAKNSQHPRAYEVLHQTVKTLVDSNEKLLTLQKQKKELDTENKGKTMPGVNVEQAVFVGNTTDLQKLIDKQKKNG